jgi:hypothetical protein
MLTFFQHKLEVQVKLYDQLTTAVHVLVFVLMYVMLIRGLMTEKYNGLVVKARGFDL